MRQDHPANDQGFAFSNMSELPRCLTVFDCCVSFKLYRKTVECIPSTEKLRRFWNNVCGRPGTIE